ncbi:MAG: hypothetical protein ACLP59_24870 [Bryobacteraceae bacterium]
MGQPSWRPLRTVTVPDRAGNIWTPALDYITPNKLYLLVVEAQSHDSASAAEATTTPAPAAAPSTTTAVGTTTPAPVAATSTPAPTTTPAPPPSTTPPPAPACDQRWTIHSGEDCTADGDALLSRSGPLLLDNCPAGALIAKIGGGSADVKPDKTTIFGVGRHCVFSVTEATKTGSLYLGINDVRESMGRVQGSLEVKISESL